jgi:predicted phage terminase large subunit-like protein
MMLRPQPGAQELFLKSRADIVIYGGAAGGGKSYALLLEPLRHVLTNPQFNAVFFRRTTTQVRNPGGLWDESVKIYSGLPNAQPLQTVLEWKFAGGGKVKFAHLEHENTVNDWQGSQIPLIIFDELCHFSRAQFWYLLSRNRSMCGVRPYVRASCNPDADSWVAEFIAWWIDQQTGLPIPARAGVLRWFIRVGETLVWGDSPADLPEQRAPDGQIVPPKSLTFVPAKLSDNAALMAADPNYYANLMALPLVERERLLGGNWKIRPSAGLYFQRSWVEVVDAVPAGLTVCRGWDLAATPETGSNDPDWTSGTKIGKSQDGIFYVLDQTWLRGTPQAVQSLILNTASQDSTSVTISIPQDPGQAGKSQAIDYVRRLAGYKVEASVEPRNLASDNPTPSKSAAKITRFSPFSAQAEGGNVKILRGNWNGRYFDELEGFPDGAHDDSADSTSRAFNHLTAAPKPARVTSFPFMAR